MNVTDPYSTGILAVGGLIASKGLLDKLLGPTFDYLGEGGLGLVKKTQANLERIFRIACEKLGERLDKPGQVNPRVLKHICDEGRFVEDVFCAEYFGGMLASSRSEDGRDEGAIPFVSLIKSMSSTQIRLHFIVYSLLAKHRFSRDATESSRFWRGLQLQVPRLELLRAMGLSGHDAESELLLALTGLVDQQLLREDFDQDGNPFVIGPNERGARLFLRALGSRGLSAGLITSINVDYGLSAAIKAELCLPESVLCTTKSPSDPLTRLQKEFESQLSDLESTVDDVQAQLKSLKESATEDYSEFE